MTNFSNVSRIRRVYSRNQLINRTANGCQIAWFVLAGDKAVAVHYDSSGDVTCYQSAVTIAGLNKY
ncbi:MAG: hypothetical protein RL308_3265 [Bacteroidota bacterium]|jgi:hypothetical protein